MRAHISGADTQKRLIVGGLEELSYYALAGLAKSNALSTKGTCMPFGSEADGFLMGEGCAVFLR